MDRQSWQGAAVRCSSLLLMLVEFYIVVTIIICIRVVLELCWSYAGVMLELCPFFFFVIDGFIMI